MSDGKAFYIKLFGPLLAGLLIPLLLTTQKFKPVITPPERELASFTYQPLSLAAPSASTFSGTRECLVVPLTGKKPTPSSMTTGYPPVPLSAFSRKQTAESDPLAGNRLSMVYHDGERRMAIINGTVLKEGDSTPNGIVTRIERNRVLIRTAGREQWLTLEE